MLYRRDRILFSSVICKVSLVTLKTLACLQLSSATPFELELFRQLFSNVNSKLSIFWFLLFHFIHLVAASLGISKPYLSQNGHNAREKSNTTASVPSKPRWFWQYHVANWTKASQAWVPIQCHLCR
jgi:hypothetical protein